jgi:hypothetical protein
MKSQNPKKGRARRKPENPQKNMKMKKKKKYKKAILIEF